VRPIGRTVRQSRDKKGYIESTCTLFDDEKKIVFEDLLAVMNSGNNGDYRRADMTFKLFLNRKLVLNLDNADRIKGIEKIRKTGNYEETVSILKNVAARNSWT
jgi:hypothetical protein